MNLFSNIDWSRFLNSLQYMWKGMLCILIVIGVIICAVYALNTAFGKWDQKKKQKQEQDKQ